MKQFFKFMFASMVGYILAGLLITFLFFGIIAIIVSAASEGETVEVKKNSVLLLQFTEAISERGEESPFEGVDIGGLDIPSEIGLKTILESIENAKSDGNIKGIYMDMTGIQAGVTQVEEIRNALVDFKKSGKFIIANSYSYTQGSYYLATTADKIFLNPEGNLFFVGLSAEVMFFKGTLDKLGIEAQIVRHGKFKGAIEPFTRTDISPENREQYLSYISAVWNNMLQKISESRNVSVDSLNYIANNLKTILPEDLLATKMIDGIKFSDEVEAHIKGLLKIKDKSKINFVELKDYMKVPSEKKFSRNKIAIIYAEGNIMTGKGEDELIGSDSYAELIRKARKDSSIKVIVLRINSPGGSSTASDIILREIKLTQKVKPVIVSMGDLAASGGYYIACSADTIVASPSTLTGSIGVFGMFFNANKLLSEKIGINIETINTNTHADFGNINRKLTETEYNAISTMIEDVYATFVHHVMEGRNMTWNEVDSIAQGRIWSGTDAKRLGLVDVIGGLNDAIVIAAKKVGLKEYRIVEYPEQQDAIEKIIGDLSGDAKIKSEMGETYLYYKHFREVAAIKGIQTRLPFTIEIH